MPNSGRHVTAAITWNVIAGLDPAIHHRKNISLEDGYAGPGYAKASPGLSCAGTPKL
jgi:hypothetical protein